MKHFPKALKRAISDTAAYMTYDVRQSAREHGWTPEEVSALRVRHVDGAFKILLEGEHAEKAHTREFGTETQRPTGVVRKYGNNPGKSAEILHQRINKHLGSK